MDLIGWKMKSGCCERFSQHSINLSRGQIGRKPYSFDTGQFNRMGIRQQFMWQQAYYAYLMVDRLNSLVPRKCLFIGNALRVLDHYNWVLKLGYVWELVLDTFELC